MSWGEEYGIEYGDAVSGQDFACTLAAARVFGWHPRTGDFRKFMCGLVEVYGEILEVLDELSQSFDVETAVGAQLDIVGRKVGLARAGFSDARYRVLIQIQIELIIGADSASDRWSGTGESILTITRRFVGPDVGAIGLQYTKPKDFILSVPGNPVASEIDTLVFFLTKAVWSEVLGHVLFALDPDGANFDSETAGAAIDEIFNWDSETAGAAIADTRVWGTDILIGVE